MIASSFLKPCITVDYWCNVRNAAVYTSWLITFIAIVSWNSFLKIQIFQLAISNLKFLDCTIFRADKLIYSVFTSTSLVFSLWNIFSASDPNLRFFSNSVSLQQSVTPVNRSKTLTLGDIWIQLPQHTLLQEPLCVSAYIKPNSINPHSWWHQALSPMRRLHHQDEWRKL